MPDVLVPLANGVEEMEAVIIIDVLRRAQWTVVSAGIDDGVITASRGVRLLPDKPWAEIDPAAFEILMIPGGGPGVERLLRAPPLPRGPSCCATAPRCPPASSPTSS